ncbi:hypothetical protein [Massilia sp. NP310]|uniref:hypothetical protein n=1 Tax=Massilia sp. NP310 TaxID=2861282 RepID=UPI001C6279D0|nr:hypothetical protein [Massilia sp. NP310]QYG02516.1 hypothetical protein KY496_03530 [Massilia sp. NP310]
MELKEKKLPDPFGVIENAGDLSLVMQVAAFAFFLDTLLLAFKGKNLLSFSWGSVEWSAEVGEIMVAGLLYAILLSVLIPILDASITAILRWYPLRRFFITFDEREAKRRPTGCVTDNELLIKADAEQSTYLLEKYRESITRSANAMRLRSNMGTGALRILVMLSLNLYFSTEKNLSTIMSARAVFVPANFDFAFAIAVLALLVLCFRSWLSEPYQTIWVYYPQLFEELTARKKPRYLGSEQA